MTEMINVFATDSSKFLNKNTSFDDDKILFKHFLQERDNTKSSIVSKDKFIENFDTQSSNLFLCMDWNNMIVAGGSILGLLTKENIENKDFGDFDIFLYGLTEREYNSKIIEIYNNFKKVQQDFLCIRSLRAITFIFGPMKRYIQVILKSYDSINQIIDNFDIDCVCVAYDGNNVWCNERSYQAITTGINDVKLEFSSASFEYRLAKYGSRGFGVHVKYDKEKINSSLYKTNHSNLHGLARLLALESLCDDGKYNLFCDILDHYQISM